jgi:valyl-tRNA synthetase
MSLPKRYNPKTAEPMLQDNWRAMGVYDFLPGSDSPVYAIDTPPPTVSGKLHLGHTFSYSQTDFMARFWRMKGYNVFYPMGFDDNGLPTERLVENREGIRARDIGREAFIERCLVVSEQAEKDYRMLWQRLGLSIDWRYTYRTIDENSRRISQLSFLDLYHKGLAYRRKAPSIWCPECQTAIAQAELDELSRDSWFYTLEFRLSNGQALPISTTRPELLPACVAVFVHPDDTRHRHLVGTTASVPVFRQEVPILADSGADPEKGTGIVMCCTFGDTTDVEWWYKHDLTLVEVIDKDGRLSDTAGILSGLSVADARARVVASLQENGLLRGRKSLRQTVRVHERCDTPVEYIVTRQWFVRVLDAKPEFLAAGERIEWYPAHMKTRYKQWVENLGWDWCITRQRYYGVTFPVWYCDECGEVMIAEQDMLPVDPTERQPTQSCVCGSSRFTAEQDVMDTWATSALSPQIVGQWLTDEALYESVFPMSLRPQAHEIIRTWAFYTIVKSHYHFNSLPWSAVAISGWGLAPEGAGKISKSRGGGPMPPMEMIDRYSADAVRYWAASTGLGKDTIISEEKIQAGARLVTKLWNVARFSQRFLIGDSTEPYTERNLGLNAPVLTPADKWVLTRTQQLIQRTTELFGRYDYASAKSEIETFFWHDLADNYLEMAKKRLYDDLIGDGNGSGVGARYALHHALLATIKLLAPLLPHITERIYGGLFAHEGESIHTSRWPTADAAMIDETNVAVGELLVDIATAVRRYKSESNLSLGTEISHLQLVTHDKKLSHTLILSTADLTSITRALAFAVVETPDPAVPVVAVLESVSIAVKE